VCLDDLRVSGSDCTRNCRHCTVRAQWQSKSGTIILPKCESERRRFGICIHQQDSCLPSLSVGEMRNDLRPGRYVAERLDGSKGRAVEADTKSVQIRVRNQLHHAALASDLRENITQD